MNWDRCGIKHGLRVGVRSDGIVSYIGRLVLVHAAKVFCDFGVIQNLHVGHVLESLPPKSVRAVHVEARPPV